MNHTDDYVEDETFTIHLDDFDVTIPKHCPHRQGWLTHGVINREKKTIACPLHFSQFSLETGERLSGPSCGDLVVVVSKPKEAASGN
ncbi:(2Fe-2S)-binding protein [Burkholderia sp. JP2-270]|uniref:Rieske (2Fe-2S) protein n=1 Tax=Burkholderia sp. JP2-270 TaxID=2217913 RepID=UPI000DA2B424|nr:Rieske 2Fe-2S domain-containing protein [Burkholderia sp. JP2-270]AWV00668.1 (2Fe-2S)-binding protein [Burkholderia sp. JP2-270]